VVGVAEGLALQSGAFPPLERLGMGLRDGQSDMKANREILICQCSITFYSSPWAGKAACQVVVCFPAKDM